MKMIDKVKRREFIFLIAWTIFTCAAIIETTFFRYTSTYNLIEPILKIIRLSSYILCILLILEQKYKRSTIIKLVLMFGVVLLSIIMSRDTEILWCFLFIAAAIGIKIEKIIINLLG